MTRDPWDSPRLEPGTRVTSRYAARWTGVVETVVSERSDRSGPYLRVVRCRITHDRNGNPVRKPFLSMPLNTWWLVPCS